MSLQHSLHHPVHNRIEDCNRGLFVKNMIPISQDPKRFVAALNKERAVMLLKGVTCRASTKLTFTSIFRRSLSSVTFPSDFKARSYVVTNFLSPQLSRALSVSPKHEPTVTWIEPEPREKIFKRAVEKKNDTIPLHGLRTADWWTGKIPSKCPGYVEGKLYSLPQVTFDNLTRESLQAYFDNTWTLTEVLLGSLQGEEAFMCPPYHDLRHPMIFYYGHPAALYVNKLRVAGLLKDPINPYFESIFETGVDEMSWDDLSKNKMPWPSVAEVHAYRKKVYNTVSNVIQSLSDQQVKNINQSSPLWSVVMGFEHERIHLETSSFLINELPAQYVRFPDGFPAYHPSVAKPYNNRPVRGVDYPENTLIAMSSKEVTIGKPADFPSFGWDNEYGQRTFQVPAFSASKFKISNGEYWEFVKEGGYANRANWTEQGWKWRSFRNVKWPLMWSRKGPQGYHEYDLRLIFDSVQMPWDWPVVVNFHEASAFAKWKGEKEGRKYRILTELEHRVLRDESEPANKEHDPVAMLAGNEMNKANTNANLAYSSMSPVNAYPANSKGFHDVFGNAWEWTEDYFSALSGFSVHPFYEDFSTPCFDGQHHIIQGGSFISTGNEASVHSRFHFRPHFHQHASFRIVEAEQTLTSDTDAPAPYVGSYPFRRSQAQALQIQEDKNRDLALREKQSLVAKHFLPTPLSSLSAMQTMHEHIKRTLQGRVHPSDRVLEVGCGLGGMTLQLGSFFKSVIGLDHSMDAIAFAKDTLQRIRGDSAPSLTVTLANEGGDNVERKLSLPAVQGDGAMLEFRCSDPMCVPAEMKDFDLVIINDVLDHLASPNSLLGRLGGVRGLVKGGGHLVVISAYQWSEARTPRSLWIGGKEALIERMSGDFTHIKSMELPLLWHQSSKLLEGKVVNLSFFSRK